ARHAELSRIGLESRSGEQHLPLTPLEIPVSLVTTPSRLLATCTRCAGHRVTEITMTLTDGSVVDFASCHTCEHKTWTQAGVELDRPTVLQKAQKHKLPK
ncbi:MAG: hypothetical protein JWO60_2500, partial [Frankiales bacterium]|nr:hypothetical protein [Frankiales bacterium]